MAESRRDRIESIFHEALERPAEEREAYLRDACEGDSDLYKEVASLVAGASRMETGFLGAPVDGVGALGEAAEAAAAGRRATIGNYRLLGALGEGGFGVVYLAEQTEPVLRRVALKVIKPGMDSKTVLARFEAERQALAMMDHPGIAKVFDAGATEEGRPFFVMEHVPGVPITEFCDKRRLDIPSRLRLFEEVCDAIQHAHQKGVIHRDIKPSNVLVEMLDGKPAAKVIDFGVAKALHQKLTEKTIFTEQGQLIGTPEYMSPEQAEMSALAIDTRSDIYSLGVLLYELLTGCLPFDPRSLRAAGFGEIQRIIREQDPPKPSTRLMTLIGRPEDKETATKIAQARRTQAQTLRSRVRGDLDWIVMRCLEKDPSRRYATANGLREELERYLNDEPVQAGPPSAAYRIRKFVKRRKVETVSGAVVAIALVAATVFSARAAVNEARQRRAAVESLERAEFERESAQAVVEFLTEDLLYSAKPERMGRNTLVRSAVDTAADRLGDDGGRFADRPLVEAPVQQAVAAMYVELGDFRAAEPHAARAFEIHRDRLGMSDPLTAQSARQLAIVKRGLGELDAASDLLESALPAAMESTSDDRGYLLRVIWDAAVTARIRGDLDRAEELLETCLDAQERVLGPAHTDTVLTVLELADLAIERKAFEVASARLADARSRASMSATPSPTLPARIDHIAGRALLAEDAYAPAIDALAPAHARLAELYGESHPNTMAALNDLAVALRSDGRLEEAEDALTRLIEARTAVHGADQLDTVSAKHSLARLRMLRGNLPDAESLLVEVVDARREQLGATHPDTLTAMEDLAQAALQAGEAERAIELLTAALAGRRADAGPDHPTTLVTMESLAVALYTAGRGNEAFDALSELADRRRRVDGGEGEALARAMFTLGVVARALGRFEAGRDAYAGFVELAADGSVEDRQLAQALYGLAVCAIGAGDGDAAEESLVSCAQVYTRLLESEDDWRFSLLESMAGEAVAMQGRYDDAEARLLDAQAALEARGAPEAQVMAGVDRIVRLYERWQAADPSIDAEERAAPWRARLAETTTGG